MSTHKSVAFFGATGGCTAPCLAHCLKAGYTCTAREFYLSSFQDIVTHKSPTVVRNASKLTTLLETAHGVTPALIAKNLSIIVGNVKDPAVVTQTLFPTVLNPSDPKGNHAVDIIVSGIGCYPVRKPGHLLPRQEDPTLCRDAVATILAVLRARPALVKPALIMISTVGVSRHGRDIPVLLKPVYAMIHEAHEDKKAMEDLAIQAVTEHPAPIGRYFVVRPTLLTNGRAKGLERVRFDVEDGAVAKKAVGWTIARAEVGRFMFERIVRPFEGGKDEGSGKIFQVTY
jgi:hypothetical protein